MVREKLRRLFRTQHSDKNEKKDPHFEQRNQSGDNYSVNHASASTKKPDLWQRAFDELEPENQKLVKSILIPKSKKTINSEDVSTDPSVVDKLKALNGVVESVKTQYELDQGKTKIKEPAQKVIQAVLGFRDLIQAAAAFDPTGHATSVWAVVSLGLTMTQNYRSQKLAWLESCTFLADVLNRYSFVEGEYQKDPNTDQYVERALVQVYLAVLKFAAQVQSLYERSRTVFIWKSISGDSLSDLRVSISEAESHLKQWLKIIDRREQSNRGTQLLEKADRMLTNIDQVMDSLNELNCKMVLAELKIAEEAHYNADTGEEYQECLPETRVELLKDIKSWATDPNMEAVFWLQGMAGTGKSTVSRTVARWLSEEGLLGGSFFFKKGSADREDAKRLFTTLTKQLLDRLPHLLEPVKRTIKETRGIGSSNPKEQFNELIFNPIKNIKLGLNSPLILVLVIDALDECQVPAHVDAIFKSLPRLTELEDVKLRVFVTSRPEPPVSKGFRLIRNEGIILHEIERTIVEHDISVFLRERLQRVRDDHELAEDWPGEISFKVLVNMAVPLFIYAATIYRFINCEGELPNDRLQAILSLHSRKGKMKVDGEYSKLTGIYLPVLKHIISQKKSEELREWMRDFRRVMGTIVLLFSPLSSVSLANLTCSNQEKVQARLSSLHSVVSVPKDSDAPVQLLHLSFQEFLVDRAASDEFWIDELAGHTQLAKDCLACMSRELKKDICSLSTPAIKRSEVEKAVLETYISPELRYACRYWIRHFVKGNKSCIKWISVEVFLKTHFLHWLEAMSLLGWCSDSIQIITDLQGLAKKNGLNAFLEDAKRFILKNRQVADETPLQIYYAGLIFAPQMSLIRRVFEAEIPTWVSQLPKVEEQWSAELQILEGHSGEVHSVAMSPDGRLLASGSDDSSVRLWNAATGDLQQTFKGHLDEVHAVAFSPDGRLLASGSFDGTVRLWDSTTGDVQRTLEEHTGSVYSVVISPDGQLLASGSGDRTVRLWLLATGAVQQILEGHSGSVRSVAISPDCRLLAFGSADNTVRIWDLATGDVQQIIEGHSGAVHSVAFSPDGGLLASGSFDRTVRLWDLTTGDVKRTLKDHSSPIRSVAFSPDGRLLASSSVDGSMRLWDPAMGDVEQTLEGHSSPIHSIVFSADGRLLLSGSSDKTVRLWDLTTSDVPQTLEGHSNWVLSVAISPDCRLLASGSADNTVRLWDPATGDVQQILQGHSNSVYSVAFSPDGRLLASGSGDRTVRLWDSVTGEIQKILEGHVDWVSSIAISPDCRLLASGSDDNTVRICDPATGDVQQILEGHLSRIRSVAFSPDGRLLASSSIDGSVRLWDPTTGDVQQTFNRHATFYDLELYQYGSYVITNLDALEVQLGNEISTYMRLTVSTEQQQWINLNRKNVLWLPPHFRSTCYTVNKSLLALGHASGRVSFLRFCL